MPNNPNTEHFRAMARKAAKSRSANCARRDAIAAQHRADDAQRVADQLAARADQLAAEMTAP
ncbi:MAG: hypothetical protein WBB07_15565 [Mycobacterium sp.]